MQGQRYVVVDIVHTADGLHRTVAEWRPQLVLVNERILSSNGIPVPIKLRMANTALKVVALCLDRNMMPVHQFRSQGFNGAISLHAGTEGLLELLDMVMQGLDPFPVLPAIAPNEKNTAPKSILTAREIEIVARIARGSRSLRIATEMSISANTVLTHRRNIAKKLGVSSAAEMIVKAQQLGLI